MNKPYVPLTLMLLALSAALPAVAQASSTGPIAHSRGLIELGSAEGEGETAEEGEAAEEGNEGEAESEGAEAEEEAEEGGAAGPSHRREDARHDPRLTSLALTHGVLEALRHGRLRASGLCFSFTLSNTSKVQAVLSTQSRSAGHTSWHELSSLTLTGRRGSNLAHFRGHLALDPGYDRLTLTPSHGTQRTISFRVG